MAKITVIEPKRIPFANDPDLKRTCARLGSTGSQFAGWISERPVQGYADPSHRLRRQVLSHIAK